VPRLWNKTIEAHRREVGDAILDTAASLVGKHGLRSVTMSQIAEEIGIGPSPSVRTKPAHAALVPLGRGTKRCAIRTKKLCTIRISEIHQRVVGSIDQTFVPTGMQERSGRSEDERQPTPQAISGDATSRRTTSLKQRAANWNWRG